MAISAGESLDNMQILWPSIVTDYSKRRLTFPSDKLPALAGIAMVVHQNTGYQYVAGLWREAMLREVCWKAVSTLSLGKGPANSYDRPGFAVAEYRAPSFSWASVDDPVELQTSSSELGKCEASLHDVQIELRGQNQFGEVRAGFLVLEGPVIALSLSCEEWILPEDQNSDPDSGLKLLINDDAPSRVGAGGKIHNYHLHRIGTHSGKTRKRFHPDTPLSIQPSPAGGVTVGRATESQVLEPFQHEVLALSVWHYQDFDPSVKLDTCRRHYLVLSPSSTVDGAYHRIGLESFPYLPEGSLHLKRFQDKPWCHDQDWFQGAEARVVKIV
jgi:hypothetical protein